MGSRRVGGKGVLGHKRVVAKSMRVGVRVLVQTLFLPLNHCETF